MFNVLSFYMLVEGYGGRGGGGGGGESAALSSAGWMLKIWLICSDLVELFIWCLFFLHTGLGGAGCFVGFYLSVQWEECKICVGAWRAFILLDCSCWCWMFFTYWGTGAWRWERVFWVGSSQLRGWNAISVWAACMISTDLVELLILSNTQGS